MGNVRLLALDLDGTLLDRSSRIRPASLAALAAAAGRGVALALVTGRSAGSAEHFARLVARGAGARVPFAACNGAGVYSPEGRLEAYRAIPPALLESCLEVLQRAGLLASCYTRRLILVDRPWQHFAAFWGPRRPAPRSWLQVMGSTWQFVRTNRVTAVRDLRRWAAASREPVLKVFAVAPAPGDRAPLEAAAAELRRRVGRLHVTSSGSDNIEVTGPGVHKGWGLCRLAERLRVPREAVMAVGDGFNDLEMLEWAGTGVAMGNAPAAVRARAAHVAPSFEEDGVAAAVRRYILGEEA